MGPTSQRNPNSVSSLPALSGAALVSSDNPHRDRVYIGEFDDRFLPGKRYSLILMLDVLEHLPDPAAALRRVESLLQPDGKFVVTVPAFRAL